MGFIKVCESLRIQSKYPTDNCIKRKKNVYSIFGENTRNRQGTSFEPIVMLISLKHAMEWKLLIAVKCLLT